ncbi:MAG: tryptophan synthase subunit beta like protein [Bacteroidota bacterium]
MPYVNRNEAGEIKSVSKEKPDVESEFLAPDTPELLAFLDAVTQTTADQDFSLSADLHMVRVIEDLINLMISKRLIVLTELPVAVQHKLLEQRARRERHVGSVSIINSDKDGLF